MVNVCGFCAQAHKRQRKTANHEVISLHEAQRQGTENLHCPVLCQRHSLEELKLFCETCDQPVCRECCLVEHREHLIEYTEEVAEHHAKVGSIFHILVKTKQKICLILYLSCENS